MSSGLTPGRASSSWRMHSRAERTMERSCSWSSWYTARTEPLELFSMGSTPNLHRPDSTAAATAWELLTYMMFPRGSSRSQATWELAPSTPWQATRPVWGKISPPSFRAASTRSATRVGTEISSA